MYFYGIDVYYIVLVVPALIFAMWAQIRVSSAFSRYSQMRTEGGLTGADAARLILDRNGLTNVAVELTEGRLSDHYDPRAEVIRLSREVYYNATVAAVGVAAHECGHAVQHAEEYFPLRVRSAIIPVTQIGSKLAFPLFLLGLLFSYPPLMDAGILLFALVAVFQLVTLPVEYNASSRAVATLSGSGMVSAEEERGVRKVLSAAALTYVAALATALANLLRLILIAGRRNNRN
ncbi:zinc metallopeptidase [Anaerofilum sp. BX8]|uniref:Zinc metallopeptidase n=1 Tax=Anaerofilum hominis TaxID=2763016 RepID=A0A923IFT3_9FIRM|nr:zinc metallopeptidase [Anaerofilum hominis]MBC5582212.1 zinc metallopeptidase [Anaerofilum hominis]